MNDPLYEEMFRLEQTHWWFAAKRQIIFSMLRQHLPAAGDGRRQRVCDVGCGCGMTLAELGGQGFEAVGLDANEKALEYCRQRGVQASRAMLPDEVPLPPHWADAVLMLDVLEHLDDDRAALAAAVKLVRPGGLFIATVPAYQWLWTSRDDDHHHKRRYNRAAFRELMTSDPSCRPVLISYFNTLLFPVAAAARLAGKFARSTDHKGDLAVLPLGINGMMRWLFASERWQLKMGIPLPAGLSLIAVARVGETVA